jgi:hypothetical protein
MAGHPTNWVQREGVFELDVTTPQPERNPDGTTDPDNVVDDWSISTQFVESKVWSDDYLRVYIKDNSISTLPDPVAMADVDGIISTYKATIDDNLKKFYKADGTIDSTRTGPTPLVNFKPMYANNTPVTDANELQFLKDLYDHIVKGSDKVRAARTTLVRRRTVSYSSALRYKVENVNVAWIPSKLYADFAVPGTIQTLLPTVPAEAPPPRTKWAWALNSQSSETSGTGIRVVERLEWVFGPVREYTYKIYT